MPSLHPGVLLHAPAGVGGPHPHLPPATPAPRPRGWLPAVFGSDQRQQQHSLAPVPEIHPVLLSQLLQHMGSAAIPGEHPQVHTPAHPQQAQLVQHPQLLLLQQQQEQQQQGSHGHVPAPGPPAAARQRGAASTARVKQEQSVTQTGSGMDLGHAGEGVEESVGTGAAAGPSKGGRGKQAQRTAGKAAAKTPAAGRKRPAAAAGEAAGDACSDLAEGGPAKQGRPKRKK
jgi:hypothetical protein